MCILGLKGLTSSYETGYSTHSWHICQFNNVEVNLVILTYNHLIFLALKLIRV